MRKCDFSKVALHLPAAFTFLPYFYGWGGGEVELVILQRDEEVKTVFEITVLL